MESLAKRAEMILVGVSATGSIKCNGSHEPHCKGESLVKT